MRTTLTLCVAAIIPIFSLSSPTERSRQDRDLVVSINGPRPLADAVTMLQSKFAIPISYEDVALIYAGDYARALDTDWGRKYAEQNAQFKAANRFGLVGGSLDIHVAIDPASARPVLPGTAPAARACAAAYSASSSTIVAAGASAEATRTFSRVMPA